MFEFEGTSGGFTLIELMIVILILGILVGIAVPVYTAQSKNAEDSVCRSNLRTLKGAAGSYLGMHGGYPSAVDDMVPEEFESKPVCPVIGTDDSYTIVSGGGDEPPVFSCNYHGAEP